MTEEALQSTEDIKREQSRYLLLMAFIAVLIAIGVYYLMESSSTNAPKNNNEQTAFSSPIEHVNTQSVWMERAQNKLKEQERQTIELKNEMLQIKNKSNLSIEDDPRFKEIEKQNQLLQKKLDAQEMIKTQSSVSENASSQVFNTSPGARVNGEQSEMLIPESLGIDNDDLQLKSTSVQPTKNPNTFVPAGTFAEGIMLGAADASAGVQSQANPSPMLFRIIANGSLPNHRKSHLKNCVVTAAVVGDISSERGQIRLERMSCTFPNGRIVEQPVEGTIFGMDAKYGVRGTPVWREGALLGRAAIAGTLSGLDSAIAQTYTTNSISPLGSTQTVNQGDIFKYGAAQGASNAMEKLADYNIRRAEQYHPIIQLSAGQPVDVVFLKGFYLDGHQAEERDEKTSPKALFPDQAKVSDSFNQNPFSRSSVTQSSFTSTTQTEDNE